MKQKFIPYLIIALVCCVECTSNRADTIKKEGETKDQLLTINLEECLKKKQTFKLSSIADTVEYLVLKTPKDIIITDIRKVVIAHNYIFLKSKDGVIHQFDTNGKYIRPIGGIGRGPGEYTWAKDFFVDTVKKQVCISHIPRLSFYNYQGKHLKTIHFNAEDIAIQNSTILGAAQPVGIQKNILTGITSKSDTIFRVPNYFLCKKSIIYGSLAKIQSSFYLFGANVYFKGYEENDTIWKISETNCVPHIAINMGKLKLPLEYTPNYDIEKFNKVAHRYYGVPRVSEDDNLIYLTAQPRISKEWYTNCIIFDKQTNTGYSTFDNDTPGIKDDILNGPTIWPWSINENYYIDWIEAFELLDFYEKNKTGIHVNLSSVISGLNETSNTLLILCKKKKEK